MKKTLRPILERTLELQTGIMLSEELRRINDNLAFPIEFDAELSRRYHDISGELESERATSGTIRPLLTKFTELAETDSADGLDALEIDLVQELRITLSQSPLMRQEDISDAELKLGLSRLMDVLPMVFAAFGDTAYSQNELAAAHGNYLRKYERIRELDDDIYKAITATLTQRQT